MSTGTRIPLSPAFLHHPKPATRRFFVSRAAAASSPAFVSLFTIRQESLTAMAKRRVLLFLILAALTLSPIIPALHTSRAQGENPTECLTSYDAAVDYFPEKATVEYATGFSVEYANSYKLVTVSKPWQGAESAFRYALLQCGAPAPTDLPEGTTIIEVPIKRLISMSSTYLPPLVDLGVVETLVGVDSLAFAYAPEVIAAGKAGTITEVGSGPTLDLEKIAVLDPDVIMTFGSGSADYDSHPKLIQAGFPTVLNGDFIEPTPLGRAEWIKFIALFYNQEGAAAAYFDDVATEYNRLKVLAEGAAEKPLVLFNTPYEGTWYIPGGASFTNTLLEDAGGRSPWADDATTGTLFLSLEVVFEKAANADVWLNPGFVFSLQDITAVDSRLAEFAPFASGKAYNYTGRTGENGAIDFFESGVTRPDLILADWISILHPDLLPDHTLYYYVQLK